MSDLCPTCGQIRPPVMPDGFCSREEAAEILGVRPLLLCSALWRRRLPWRTIGRRLIIARADLDAAIAAGNVPGGAQDGRRLRGRHFTPAEFDQARAMVARRDGLHRIASALNVPVETARRELASIEITHWDRRSEYHSKLPERLPDIERAITESWTLKRLGEFWGVSRERARQYVARSGLTPQYHASVEASRAAKTLQWIAASNPRFVLRACIAWTLAELGLPIVITNPRLTKPRSVLIGGLALHVHVRRSVVMMGGALRYNVNATYQKTSAHALVTTPGDLYLWLPPIRGAMTVPARHSSNARRPTALELYGAMDPEVVARLHLDGPQNKPHVDLVTAQVSP